MARRGARPGSRKRGLICLIDAVTLSREGLSRILQDRTESEYEVEALAAPEGLAPGRKVAAVVYNINGARPDDPPIGVQIDEIKHRAGGAPLLIVSNTVDRKSAEKAMEWGARGCIPSTVQIDMLVAATRLVVAGGTYLPSELLSDYVRQADEQESGILYRGFTARETEIVARIQEGKINKAIAGELNIAEGTVKVHLRHIMKKLNATNRTQVALLLPGQKGSTVLGVFLPSKAGCTEGSPLAAEGIDAEVVAGSTYPDYLQQADEQERGILHGGFTAREAEIVTRIAEGKINKTIAEELDIAESTVKGHVQRIMRKLHATNRTQVALLLARQRGSRPVGRSVLLDADRPGGPCDCGRAKHRFGTQYG